MPSRSRPAATAGSPGPRSAPSDLEPRVLEVEVALYPGHRLARDRAGVAHLDDRVALRLEHLAHRALVEHRAPVVVLAVVHEARFEAARAVLVHRAHPLDRLVARPFLLAQLVEPLNRRLGRLQPGLRL